MRGLVEAAVFLGLAAGVHLVVVANLSGEPGARGSGDGGEALTSLEAAPESFAALARAWGEGPDAASPVAAPEPPETAGERPLQAQDASPPDAPEPRGLPAPPDAPRGERDLPAAGPQVPQGQIMREPAPEPGSAPPVQPDAGEAPVSQSPPIAAEAPPDGEVTLPAPGPQVPATAQDAPDGLPTGAAMPGDAPADDGPPSTRAESTAQAAPQAPDAPQGDAGATVPAPLPQPSVQVTKADESHRRPQPRPDPALAQRQPKDSPPRPAVAPAPDSAPQPAQQARGAGEGSAAGAQQDSPSAALSDAERQSALASWGGGIRARIEQHKRYPAEARNRRLSGTTTVRMEVARDGRLLSAAVSASSGHGVLDRAALDAVRDAGRFTAAPEELREASFRFDLPVSFQP